MFPVVHLSVWSYKASMCSYMNLLGTNNTHIFIYQLVDQYPTQNLLAVIQNKQNNDETNLIHMLFYYTSFFCV